MKLKTKNFIIGFLLVFIHTISKAQVTIDEVEEEYRANTEKAEEYEYESSRKNLIEYLRIVGVPDIKVDSEDNSFDYYNVIADGTEVKMK